MAPAGAGEEIRSDLILSRLTPVGIPQNTERSFIAAQSPPNRAS